ILISEYYPKVLPDAEVSAVPIQRLTPFFHDIHFENVTARGSDWAGIVIGCPESPVKELTMKNVSIAATKGLDIAFAQVTLDHVTVTAAQGEPINVAKTAQVLTV